MIWGLYIEGNEWRQVGSQFPPREEGTTKEKEMTPTKEVATG